MNRNQILISLMLLLSIGAFVAPFAVLRSMGKISKVSRSIDRGEGQQPWTVQKLYISPTYLAKRAAKIDMDRSICIGADSLAVKI